MDVIKEHHPSWPKDKKMAVMLNQARRAGAKIPRNPHDEAMKAVKRATA